MGHDHEVGAYVEAGHLTTMSLDLGRFIQVNVRVIRTHKENNILSVCALKNIGCESHIVL